MTRRRWYPHYAPNAPMLTAVRITVKFADECPVCHTVVEVNDRAWYLKGQRIQHIACGPPIPAPAGAAPFAPSIPDPSAIPGVNAPVVLQPPTHTECVGCQHPLDAVTILAGNVLCPKCVARLKNPYSELGDNWRVCPF